MITRIWHGTTRKTDSDAYRQYVVKTGVHDYAKTRGNLGVQIWQRDEGDITHIWTVTQWKDLESVGRFAGNDIEKARYYPEDDRFLLNKEPKVIHCHTYAYSTVRIKYYIRQIEQLYAGGSWNAESFADKLNDVDEEQAFQQPAPGKHSVAEILWHCTYWRTVLVKRMQGDDEYRDKTVDELNFLPLETLKRKGWKTLVSEFHETQNRILELLGTRDDDFLDREYKQGSTFDDVVEGIVHHDLYHLGQIGLVISLNKAQQSNVAQSNAASHHSEFAIRSGLVGIWI